MKLILKVAVALILTTGLAVGQVELVESFPQGTDFDQADIRDTQEVWLELLEGAQDEILWHTFYVAHEKGASTEPILRSLQRAARRGVKIKILADHKFRETYPEPLKSLHEEPNIEVRSSPIGRWFGGVMHAKMILVDRERGFIGSQNFDWRSLQHIRELGVLFQDRGLVADYAAVFDWEWNHHQAEKPQIDKPDIRSQDFLLNGERVRATVSPVALNTDPKTSDEYQIRRLLREADSTVEIALLSYSPVNRDGKTYYPELENAIRAAATRGVKVRLMVSHWVEKKKSLDHLLSLDALGNVEVRACRIPEASVGEIPFARVHHSKYLIVDGKQAWLGTSNWSYGYFHSSRNYGMIFLDSRIPKRLERLFQFDWERSTPLKKIS